MLVLKNTSNLGGRTIMLGELAALLEAVPRRDASVDDYKAAIMDENCFGKPTMATRKEAIQRSRKGYGLDFAAPVFAMFHRLWPRNPACRHLLGFQCAWVNNASYGIHLPSSCRFPANRRSLRNRSPNGFTRHLSRIARGGRTPRAREGAARQARKNLEGGAPYDIFVRWKPLAEQPVGWNPDPDDGVRLNIRPFCEAGVLREKAQRLNIKWGKDRGKDVPSAPWYPLFHGDRINDHHLSLALKKAARGELQS